LFIRSLKIENFKSIENAEVGLKRVNVLIGEPGSEKSNVLEALGILPFIAHGGEFADYVRAEKPLDLFHLFAADREILVEASCEELRTITLRGELKT